jgi:hypothetical protein
VEAKGSGAARHPLKNVDGVAAMLNVRSATRHTLFRGAFDELLRRYHVLGDGGAPAWVVVRVVCGRFALNAFSIVMYLRWPTSRLARHDSSAAAVRERVEPHQYVGGKIKPGG